MNVFYHSAFSSLLLALGIIPILSGCATHYESPVVYRPAPSPAQEISRGPATAQAYAPAQAPAAVPSLASAPVTTPAPRLSPASTPMVAPAPAASALPNASSGSAIASDNEQVVIPLHEERVQVGTREVENGAVRLRKVVRTETVNQPVTLRREELVVDRLPAAQGGVQTLPQTTQQEATLDQPFTEQSVTIPLKRQEPVVQKEVVQTGEVVAKKRVTEESTTVQQPVRSEDVQVVRLGDAQNGNSASGAQSSINAGTAPGYQAGTATAASGDSGAVTSLAALANTPDLRSLAAKAVQLSAVPIQQVIDNRLVTLEGPDGRLFYIRTPSWINGLRPGDLVDLQGRIEMVPKSVADLGLGPDAAAALQTQPIFIDATNLLKVRH